MPDTQGNIYDKLRRQSAELLVSQQWTAVDARFTEIHDALWLMIASQGGEIFGLSKIFEITNRDASAVDKTLSLLGLLSGKSDQCPLEFVFHRLGADGRPVIVHEYPQWPDLLGDYSLRAGWRVKPGLLATEQP